MAAQTDADAVVDAQADEDLAAEIEWLVDHPVNLGNDPLGVLEAVPGVPAGFAARAENARALLPFRRAEGLLRVPGADPQLLARLRPYVVAPAAVSRTRGRLSFESSFGGLPRGERLIERSEFARGGVRFGGVLERDPRERALADYRSAWLDLRAGRARVVAGALDVDWGRGLVLSSARAATGAALSLDRALRAGRGLSAHRGVGEEGHFRGVAAEVGGARCAITVLGSRTPRDARVNDEGNVTSLADGGLHRTASEVAARDRLDDATAAVRAELRWRGGARLATSFRATGLNPPLAPRTGSSLPTGRRDSAAGADLAAPLGPVFVAAEWAVRAGGGAARIGGAEWRRGASAVALTARRYDANYRTLHAAPPAARGRSANEVGLTWRARTRVAGVALEAVHDRWSDVAPPREGSALEHGRETRVALEAGRGARRYAVVASRKTRFEELAGDSNELDASDRYALRVQLENRLRGNSTVSLVASGVTLRSDGEESRRGGYVQGRVRIGGFAGFRPAFSATRFSGDSGAVVPRLPETLFPGSVRFVSLASSARLSGWRTSLVVERVLTREARLSIGAVVHAPRGAAAVAEGALSLRIGPSRIP
ncbi:MAG: hypothetical protein ACKVU1_03850 [bacterium]